MNLPVTPLVSLVDSRRISPNRWGEADSRAYQRAKAAGVITEQIADRLCVKHLDIQPELLWPELTQ